MLGILLTAIALIWLLAAAIFDFKTREIPDWLSYSLTAIVILAYLTASLQESSFSPLLWSILTALLFAILALLLYFTRQWGGGDVKLFIALGAAFPRYPAELLAILNPDLSLPFPLIILINLAVIAVLYSLLYLIILILQHQKQFNQEIKKHPYKKLKLLIIFAALLILIFTWRSPQQFLAITLIILLLLFPYLLAATKSIEKVAMLKEISIRDLSPGEWLAEDIHIHNRKLISHAQPELTSHHIALLKKHNIKSVKVKLGIPFAPTFFLSLLLSLLFGNIIRIF